VCNSGFLYPCRWYNDFSQKFATRAPKKCQKKISNLKTLWKMESKIHLQSVFCFKVSRSDTEHICLLYIGTCFRDTFVFRIWQKCLLILKLFWFSTLLLCVVKRCIKKPKLTSRMWIKHIIILYKSALSFLKEDPAHMNCENWGNYINGPLNSSITIITAKLFFIPSKFLVLKRTNLIVTISVLQISG